VVVEWRIGDLDRWSNEDRSELASSGTKNLIVTHKDWILFSGEVVPFFQETV
jgi:hypothetical protein